MVVSRAAIIFATLIPTISKSVTLCPRYGCHAASCGQIGRFENVRAALRADSTLISGKGAAANSLTNSVANPVTLTGDGEVHVRRRAVLTRPLLPGSLKDLRPRLEDEARRLVRELASAGPFDAMARFASHLPAVLRHGAPARLADAGRMGSAVVFDAADAGDLSPDEAREVVIGYVGPALDTTILATGHMLWRLATTPETYAAVRAASELIPGVVNEVVPLASPLRCLTRFAARVYVGDGSLIPEGSMVLILFASAKTMNRRRIAAMAPRPMQPAVGLP